MAIFWKNCFEIEFVSSFAFYFIIYSLNFYRKDNIDKWAMEKFILYINIAFLGLLTQIYDRILSISSREGETVELHKPVMAEGNVEVWLNSLLEESQASLHLVIRQAAANIQETGFQLIEFLSSFPAQVSVLKLESFFFFNRRVILDLICCLL